MPEPILIACIVSAVLALPALGMAVFHATRTEKHLHISRNEEGNTRS